MAAHCLKIAKAVLHRERTVNIAPCINLRGPEQMETVWVQFGRQKCVNGLVVRWGQRGKRPAQGVQLRSCRMKLRFPLL